MKEQNAKAGHGRWWFLVVVAVLYAVCAALAPNLALRALAHTWHALHRMLPVLALVFVLLFVFDLLLSPQRVTRYLGRPGGARGWAIALAAGILSAGPIYAWYPLLAELRGKGMRASTAAVFLYARAIKLPLLPLLFHYFGSAYSVVLSLYLAGFALLSGIVMERVERAEKLPIEPVDPTWMENRAMRIAIAADAPNIDTEVAAHAARAPYFLIFDTDGRLHAAPANPVVGSGQGAGPAAVQFLSGQGVGLVVAGEFGPHFLEALAEHRIRHAQQTGPVAEVIARLVAR